MRRVAFVSLLTALAAGLAAQEPPEIGAELVGGGVPVARLLREAFQTDRLEIDRHLRIQDPR